MKKFALLIFALSMMSVSYAQEEAKVNTSYDNWYYASREKLYQALKTRKYEVLFFGDSITERGPWQELLGRKWTIGNRGIGGDNTFGMKARIADVAAFKPKKIFLMMGINDIGRGLPTEMILANYKSIIETIQQVSPKTQIYVQSPLPLNEALLPYDYLKGKTEAVHALVLGAQQLADQYKLIYVDLHEVLADKQVLKGEFTKDGIHINTDAYIKWVQYLKDKKYL